MYYRVIELLNTQRNIYLENWSLQSTCIWENHPFSH